MRKQTTAIVRENLPPGAGIPGPTVPEQEWRALPPGSAVRITLGLRGGVKSVTPDHA